MMIECRNPACGQRLRVPDDKGGVLKLRCPRCKTTFEWSAPGSRYEIREFTLRCAVWGLRSKVIFARDRPTDLFRLRTVDQNNTSVVARGKAWKEAEAARAQADAVKRGSALIAGRRLLDAMLGRLQGRALIPARGAPGAIVETNAVTGEAGGARNQESFNSADFDWSLTFCPHCEKSDGTLLRCPKCLEFVCTGTVIEIADGRESFRCHDGCGYGGPIGPPGHFDIIGKGVSLDAEDCDQLLRRHEAIDEKKQPAIGSAGRKALPAPSNDLQGRQQ